MLFNSYLFIFLFLPTVLVGFYSLRRINKHAWCGPFLLLCSLVFYSYWDVLNLPILLVSILVNFVLGNLIIKTQKKGLLVLGIVLNIMLLAYYKYTGFVVSIIEGGDISHFTPLHIGLPLAISFFTFQQIAFLVDSYRGDAKRCSFMQYSLFVSFFPQLIAGPIVQYKHIHDQFGSLFKGLEVPRAYIASGAFLFVIGLTKKVVIADSLASFVDPVFSNAGQAQFIDAWTASFAYTFQIYFDFSGYSDMAIGLGLLFGVRLPINFNSPYKATNISDFWRRWHISLGAFLREYLYIPLGGNRAGIFRTCIALTIVMALGGLWHGAGWQFIAWGLMHAVFLAVHAVWKRSYSLPVFASWFLTFFSVVIAWVMFRAASIDDALFLYSVMFGLKDVVLPQHYALVLGQIDALIFQPSLFVTGLEILLILGFVEWCYKLPSSNSQAENMIFDMRSVSIAVCAVFLSFIFLGNPTTFLYFNF